MSFIWWTYAYMRIARLSSRAATTSSILQLTWVVSVPFNIGIWDACALFACLNKCCCSIWTASIPIRYPRFPCSRLVVPLQVWASFRATTLSSCTTTL